METFAPLAAMIALLWTVVNFLKYCTNWSRGGKNGAVTQLLVWLGGVVVVFLFAQTDWASAVPVGDLTLDKMNLWSQLVAGLSIGGLTSALYDTKKAVDPSDSARTPSLLNDSEPLDLEDDPAYPDRV